MDEHCCNHIEVVCTLQCHDYQLSQYKVTELFWLTTFICVMAPLFFCSIILYNLEEKRYTDALTQPWVNLFNSLKIVFNSFNDHLASCQASRNHCEEKCEKFITRRVNNKSPSLFSFEHMQTQFLKPAGAYLFIWVNEK